MNAINLSRGLSTCFVSVFYFVWLKVFLLFMNLN